MTDLMVNHPNLEEGCSKVRLIYNKETVDKHKREIDDLLISLKNRAEIVHTLLNQMTNI